MDLKLLQKEVAARIGVTEGTIYNCERQRTVPEIRHMPGIIRFLGHCPIASETAQSFPEILKAYRTTFGLSQKKLAAKSKSIRGPWEAKSEESTSRLGASLEAVDVLPAKRGGLHF